MSTVDGATESEVNAGTNINGSVNSCMRMTSIIPDAYDGETAWDEWFAHFDCVARINGWDDKTRLLWLQVRMTGKAQRAWQRLARDDGHTELCYQNVVSFLRERFEPSSNRDLYAAKFRTMKRDEGESWAEFADNLRMTADRAFPELDDKAKERITLDHFLGSITNPTVALSVRQRHPKTLNEASLHTLEIETLQSLTPTARTPTSANDWMTSQITSEAINVNIAVHKTQETILRAINTLAIRMGELEQPRKHTKTDCDTSRQQPKVMCWKCGKVGHFSRGCAISYSQHKAMKQQRQVEAKQPCYDPDQSTSNNRTVKLLSVNPAGAYHVDGLVAGVKISFMLDTGASVSLLRADVWEKISADRALVQWNGSRLVGVEGSSIEVLGVATCIISLAGITVKGDFLVARTLSTEAILGLDFLEEHGCVINTQHRALHIQGKAIPLKEDRPSQCSSAIEAFVQQNLHLPPLSEIEVMAVALFPDSKEMGNTYLVEAKAQDKVPITVANAVVVPKQAEMDNQLYCLPVRIINPSSENVTLHKGMRVARLEQIQDPDCVAGMREMFQDDTSVSTEMQELLWTLVEKSGEMLDERQQDQLYRLLLGFSDVFSLSSRDMGRTNRLQHTIPTTTERPIRQQARRIPPFQREEVDKLLHDMLERDVIQPSTSPWASPIVLVQKKDGSIRFCVDYRKLNTITRKDAYPLPRIDDTLDTLAGSCWFSTLDLLSGYWQVEVAEADREKTAFTTQQGLFEFKVMPFGLCNAPATFQRLMDSVLAGVQWQQCLVYLDDIIVVGRDFEEHLRNLGIVLQKLKQANLRVKPEKCAMCREEVAYLGHVVSKQGVATDPEKTQKVSSWPTPTSVQDIQQFLGLASYYRRFIKDFSTIAKPLHRLTEKGRLFNWTIECANAFAELKQRLTTAPVLAFPDYTNSSH